MQVVLKADLKRHLT